MMDKCKAFLAKPFFHDYRTLLGLWLILGVVGALAKMHAHNNFLIFRGVFWHTFQQLPLYVPYPAEYWDVNHYGPLFSLVIAPFAVVPEWLGLLLWCVALSLFLYVAIRRSDMTRYQQLFVLWFCAHELLTALFMQQFNIAIAAIVVLAFFLIEKERDAEAAFFIVLGTFVKLYGIVGLAFFFFSKHKLRFVLALTGWGLALFAAPMLISSPEYIVGQYQEWYLCLVEKNGENLDAFSQNISVLGMARRIFGMTASDLWIILPAILMFAIPYLRFSQYKHVAFRQTLDVRRAVLYGQRVEWLYHSLRRYRHLVYGGSLAAHRLRRRPIGVRLCAEQHVAQRPLPCLYPQGVGTALCAEGPSCDADLAEVML